MTTIYEVDYIVHNYGLVQGRVRGDADAIIDTINQVIRMNGIFEIHQIILSKLDLVPDEELEPVEAGV